VPTRGGATTRRSHRISPHDPSWGARPTTGTLGMTAVAAPPWEALLESEEVVHRTVEPARAGRSESFPCDVHPSVAAALATRGIETLYAHQVDAWDAVRDGRDVIVTTGTASGKSLAYMLPILDAIARRPRSRALYLSPTKALARDQARAFASFALPGLRVAAYDGDTDREQRSQIRREASVLLTNPDMLHVGILPNHDRWGDVLHNLAVVVVDEAHVYRGVFGAHVANVLRRLRRLAGAYGSEPRFVLTSATIANPAELAESLTGRAAVVVDADGSPHDERDVAIWNPPLVDPALGTRASALAEGSRLLAELVGRGLRTICFTKSRKAAELVHRFTADRVGAELAGQLAPYRAGYTPEQRREIERRLADGSLLGVTATSALELGIDIGLLDCAISVGFPGTVASLRQQWGRAGRRGRGLAVLVAGDDALDQFFARDPDALFGRRVEAAIVDHENPRILDAHVLAAAYEAPLRIEDVSTLGALALERAETLPELERTSSGVVWKGRESPAGRVSLRSGDTEAYAVVDASSGALLGHVERERAYATVHEGAVYLHLGEQYVVRSLDHVAAIALVEPVSVDWYTQAKKDSDTSILSVESTRQAAGVELRFGRIAVSEQVVGYQRKAIADGSTIESAPLLMPETTFETEAVWFSPGDELLLSIDAMPVLLDALHAAEHALISLLPLWAMCDRWDLGGLSTNVHPQTGRPTIFVYDGHAGGAGLAERGFGCFGGWVADTARLVAGCPCRDGCPSCVQSPKCGNLNEHLDRRAAATLLGRMVDAS
jgi:DEAD/DEAH box helicase domain-containing protein